MLHFHYSPKTGDEARPFYPAGFIYLWQMNQHHDIRQIGLLFDTMSHMNMNGRAILIKTHDAERARLWQQLFGTDALPVLHFAPRRQEVKGLGAVLAFDLDMSALHDFDIFRLMAHVAKRTGTPYSQVFDEMNSLISWPIAAENCYVVETTDERERPSLLYWWQQVKSLLVAHKA